jgi:Mce-associated membrane protein
VTEAQTPHDNAATGDVILAEDEQATESTITDDADAELIEHGEPSPDTRAGEDSGVRWGNRFGRVLAYGILPAVALMLALAAGYLKWLDSSVRDAQLSRVESVHAARDSTVALLSYKPDTVEQDLTAARDRLTGDFKNTYTSLTHDVVIPGAKQKQISAIATVPAAGSVSATENHAVVIIFVNQSMIIGTGAPSSIASSVRVTLDKIAGRWLISAFDPV